MLPFAAMDFSDLSDLSDATVIMVDLLLRSKRIIIMVVNKVDI